MTIAEVTITQGKLRGTTSCDINGDTYFRFQGIPYAKPPVGVLRFKAPQPPENWTGVLDATKEGDPCYGRHFFKKNLIVGSENCLVLNVYTKNLRTDTNRITQPVLFWIHGGDFVTGSGTSEMYGPDYLMSENVVLVTINYRLGMLGFLSFEDVSLGVPGNAGFKDMVMALKWVQKNIIMFGGDPHNVTIFGSGSGAMSVHLLHLSPISKTLFHKAIAQSGTVLSLRARGTLAISQIASILKLKDERSVYKHLMALKVAEIYKLQKTLLETCGPFDRNLFGYVVEKKSDEPAFLKEDPFKIIASGNFNQVPLICGYVANETIGSELNQGPTFEEKIIPWFFGYEFGSLESYTVAKEIKSFYYGSEETLPRDKTKTTTLISDAQTVFEIQTTVRKHYVLSRAPTYLYRVSLKTALKIPGLPADVNYIFKNFATSIKPGTKEHKVMKRFVRLWCNFAKYAHPTPRRDDALLNVIWRFVSNDDELDFLDIGDELVASANPDAQRMKFWKKLFNKSPANGKLIQYKRMTFIQSHKPKMEPLVTTVQGQLKGTTSLDSSGEKYYKFQGIPFAKPPVGLLRFKAPEPPEKWTGVLDATKEGSPCYARHPFNNKIVGSEDCLYLNVYTKKIASNNCSLSPVLFWIHGGAFLNGSGGTEMYGPDFLITQDVVVVTINYRLGILGFLSLENPDLKVPGNAGLKDIVMALKWVQTNIKNFGGDPNNVTVFGQSAGGVAVHLLLLSQMSRGLFHKAIAQSGCAFSPWARGTTGVKELAPVLHVEEDEEKIYERLMKLPVDELFKLQEKIVSFLNIYASKHRAFAYVVEKISDGFLSEEPIDIISNGKFQQLPFMIGYTTAETWGFDSLRPDDWPGAKNLEDSIPWTLGFKTGSPESQVMTEKIKKFYCGGHIPTTIKLETKIAIHTDANFVFGVYKTALSHFSKSQAPTYLYRFSAETELNVMRQFYKIKIPGVVHCDDIGYLFKNVASPRIKPGSKEEVLLKKVVKLWTNFAKFGNPTPDNSLGVVWKPVTDKEVDYLDIGESLTPARNSIEHKRVQFLTKLYERKNSSSHL
ncbi:alpha-esterase like protein E1 isoform X1 [Tribolium castaneum]